MVQYGGHSSLFELVAMAADEQLCSCALSANCIDHILRVVAQCRSVLREVPGLGWSVCRAAAVVRSVKLVHQRIEPGEAGIEPPC
jgi:hypothetical protein